MPFIITLQKEFYKIIEDEEIKLFERYKIIEENTTTRSTLIVLSSHNDKISIHLISSNEWESSSQSSNFIKLISLNLYFKDNIIDVNQLTKDLDINYVKLAVIK